MCQLGWIQDELIKAFDTLGHAQIMECLHTEVTESGGN